MTRSRSQRPRRSRLRRRQTRPAVAYRQRTVGRTGGDFTAPEDWFEPAERDEIAFVVEPPGKGQVHPVRVDEVRDRLGQMPDRFVRDLHVVKLSRMTRKRGLFPCYGMQWGSTVYLYPIEASLVETYVRPPTPAQQVEARMYGGVWACEGKLWRLKWTPETIRDYYLNNVLIHEVGHVNDDRNTRFDDRERYANWFAIEYGYRASRGRR